MPAVSAVFSSVAEQQRRLGELGVKEAVRDRKTPVKQAVASGPGAGGGAFGRGLEALAQYIAQEGRLPRRSVVQVLPHGTEHRTGIWLGNIKARRERLDPTQLTAFRVRGPPSPRTPRAPGRCGLLPVRGDCGLRRGLLTGCHGGGRGAAGETLTRDAGAAGVEGGIVRERRVASTSRPTVVETGPSFQEV